jgi:hypothetical protein
LGNGCDVRVVCGVVHRGFGETVTMALGSGMENGCRVEIWMNGGRDDCQLARKSQSRVEMEVHGSGHGCGLGLGEANIFC